MKKYNLIIFMLATLFSCDKVDHNTATPKDPNEISFVVEHPEVLSRATATGFNDEDKIGMYAVEYKESEQGTLLIGGNFLNNEPLFRKNGVWNGVRKLYWNDGKLDFYAYYPYSKITSVNTHIFELQTDQRTAKVGEKLGGYEASDFLYAKSTNVSRADGDVKLQFKHVMAKMTIKIVKGPTFVGELPTDISVNIYNTVTTASIDLVRGSATRYPFGPTKTINAKKVNGDTFEVIVVPQLINVFTPLIEITMDGIAYLLEYNISLRSGYSSFIEVILNTSPTQEKIEISIDGTTSDDWS